MDCVCVPFRKWMGKTKYLSAFEWGIVVDARHTGLSRTATLLSSSRSTVSCVYQKCSTTQRTSSQLELTVGSIGVNMGQNPCGTLSPPCWDNAPMNWGCSVVTWHYFVMSAPSCCVPIVAPFQNTTSCVIHILSPRPYKQHPKAHPSYRP
jgi:hypothetical protein